MRITYTDGCLNVQLKGEIDHHLSEKMRREIDSEITRTLPNLLVLDFGKVEFMDSSGIGLIMGRYKLMTELGGKLRLTGIPPHLTRVFKISGISSLNIEIEGESKK